MHVRAAPAGSTAVPPFADTNATKRPAARRVIVATSGGHTELDLTPGVGVARGIARGWGATLAAASPMAWHREIEKAAPPSTASFDRTLVAKGEDLAGVGTGAGCHTADTA